MSQRGNYTNELSKYNSSSGFIKGTKRLRILAKYLIILIVIVVAIAIRIYVHKLLNQL